jgi:hypothetical protein
MMMNRRVFSTTLRFYGRPHHQPRPRARFMAKRMGATTIEVKASHLSLISHPEEIAHLILEAAGQQT